MQLMSTNKLVISVSDNACTMAYFKIIRIISLALAITGTETGAFIFLSANNSSAFEKF